MTTKHLRLGVMISGSGRTLRNLLELSRENRLPGEVVVVVSSSPEARGLNCARDAGIPNHVIDHRAANAETAHEHIASILRDAAVDLVCLAGYVHFWRIPGDFFGRVMNIHPALLPDFGGKGYFGLRVHEAVLSAGVSETGCTVHFADNEYDHGPVILQRRIAVRPDDTPDSLADRVFEQEQLAYPQAIRLFAAGRLQPDGTIVHVRPA